MRGTGCAKMSWMTTNSDAAEVTIRAIEPGDADAVSALCGELGYQRSPAEVTEWMGRAAREALSQAAFVACLGEEVVGWIEVSVERRLQSPPFAFIGGLVVKDGFRSRGIGRRLCAHAEAWSWERQLEIVRVTSRSTRTAAHRFYRREDYGEVKTSLVFEKRRPPK
jgi:ribosomal protein S18 acetylase RimI-like enzyme